jgi:hypothetical protein
MAKTELVVRWLPRADQELAGNPLTFVEQQWGHKGAANGKYPPQAGPVD